MAKSNSTPMTRQAASRIASSTAKANGGKIPAGSFASVADAVVQHRASTGGGAQGKKS